MDATRLVPVDAAALTRLHQAFLALADVPPGELARLDALVRRVRIPRGGFFVRAGERCGELAFILAGLLRCYHVNQEGKEYTKHFFREGDLVAGGTPSHPDRESQHDFEALEKCDLLLVNVRAARQVFSGHASWARAGARAIERIHEIEARRVSALLLDDARARYLRFLRDFPGLEPRLKQMHVASYVGITPVSLSRIRARLRKDRAQP